MDKSNFLAPYIVRSYNLYPPALDCMAENSVPIAFEGDSSITSPSSLGTPASATPPSVSVLRNL